MRASFTPFRSKDVFDENDETVGTIVGSELSSETREPTSLLVELDPDLQERFNAEDDTLWISCDDVRSIRREGLQIDEAVSRLLGGD